jgi:hypothetical protein
MMDVVGSGSDLLRGTVESFTCRNLEKYEKV